MNVSAELAAFNKRTATLYDAARDELSGLLEGDSLDRWSQLVVDIAASGWRAFESANTYLEVSVDLAKAGRGTLLRCGEYGLSLCGFSFEPSATYFRGVNSLVREDRLEQYLDVIESSGDLLRERFVHASNLIADYYRRGFQVAEANSYADTLEWCEIAKGIASYDRGDVLSFLNATGDAITADWSYVHELRNRSPFASLVYLEYQTDIATVFGAHEQDQLKTAFVTFGNDGDKLEDWIVRLLDVGRSLPPNERSLLVDLTSQQHFVELATCLVEAAPSLPLSSPRVVRAWARRVEDFLPLRLDAACGYLSLDSASSVLELERLMGQVNFDEVKRVLQLYAEAVVGRRLSVEATEDKATDFRSLPSTDGLSIRLPEVMDVYESVEENFALYKIALLHQLGYYEFGTFEFVRADSFVSFNDHFSSFGNPGLAANLFQLLEDARIDWAIARRYRGAAVALSRFKRDALANLAAPFDSRAQNGLLAVAMLSLDGDPGTLPHIDSETSDRLREQVNRLGAPHAPHPDVFTTMSVLETCYELIASDERSDSPTDEDQDEFGETKEDDAKEKRQAPPQPIRIDFRGKLEPDRAKINLELTHVEENEAEMSPEGEDSLSITSLVDPKDIKIEQLKKGEVQDALAMMITDLEGRGIDEEMEAADDAAETFKGAIEDTVDRDIDFAFKYDEWDTVIEDYRKRWCTLFEIREFDEVPVFVEDTLRDLKAVGKNVRRQLSHLRPELLRKVKGMEDGEELDLERAIESRIDRRAGFSPEERIYVQRQRKDRDVSALFLLDMSASTDDRITPHMPDEESRAEGYDDDDFLHDYYGAEAAPDRRKLIIDLEKEAVVLMADALEDLGDSYSVCGFSGYGRDKVDFYVCKDFDETYTLRAKGRIGGIKPYRSTRMGPAIRHATRRLVATESRIKALIIISDGYPQDFDYGKDRNSKDYGIKDTMMALSEARQQGVQAYCLTVDPSGHDYLREMCPDQQYMVIQDINQLPDELSKVYRSLTA